MADQTELSQAELKTYVWQRLRRAKANFGNTLVAMLSVKNPDARIVTAVLDRVDPKPKLSNEVMPRPVGLDISDPLAVEATRQKILTAVDNALLPIEYGERILKMVNESGDRNIARELQEMLAMAKELKEERLSKPDAFAPPDQSQGEAGAVDPNLIGYDKNNEKVIRPNWARPPKQEASTMKAAVGDEIQATPDLSEPEPDDA